MFKFSLIILSLLIVYSFRTLLPNGKAKNIEKPLVQDSIPINLEQCFHFLDSLLKPDDIAEFKAKNENELSVYHFGLGLWMRNN